MSPNKILPDLVITSRINQQWPYFGIDSPDLCANKKDFFCYPHEISYKFNSRGLRDTEWPNQKQNLQESIWCIGDSATLGLGQPFDHIWPQILQHSTGCRTINVSLDGASNNWIARRVTDITESVNPKHIVVMWSFLERRESNWPTTRQQTWERWYNQCKDSTWPPCPDWNQLYLLTDQIIDELRYTHGLPLENNHSVLARGWQDELCRYQDVDASQEQHFENWCNCIDQVSSVSNIIHCMVPRFAPDNQKQQCLEYVQSKKLTSIGECQQLDFARDGRHFDLITVQLLVKQMMSLLMLPR